MYFKKRKYVIVVLAGLIALAVYLNVVYTDTDGMFEITETVSPTSTTLGETASVSSDGTNTSSDDSQTVETGANVENNEDSAMSQARLSRQKSRDEAVQMLKEVTENESLSADDKSEAAGKITAIASAMEQEAAVENLVRAKGFSDCVAYISNGEITLTVKADGLEKNQIAQIKDIVITQTGISADKIKILETK